MEVYYDESQVHQPYQVIGTLANGGEGLGQYQAKQAIIKKAKLVGAEAVVFYDLDIAESLTLKAKAIRYDPNAKPIGNH